MIFQTHWGHSLLGLGSFVTEDLEYFTLIALKYYLLLLSAHVLDRNSSTPATGIH